MTSKQPPLLPPSPAAQARALVARSLAVLESFTLRNGGGRNGHLTTCRLGQWVDGYSGPDGAPCSAKCVTVRHLITDLEAFLVEEA